MTINFSNMGQRHLFLSYAVTLSIQLGYAGWIALNWWKLRQAQKSPASSPR